MPEFLTVDQVPAAIRGERPPFWPVEKLAYAFGPFALERPARPGRTREVAILLRPAVGFSPGWLEYGTNQMTRAIKLTGPTVVKRNAIVLRTSDGAILCRPLRASDATWIWQYPDDEPDVVAYVRKALGWTPVRAVLP